eukprot:m.113802 g.113802  ORF g.113802 m.113802 type:complete len:255 (+) comp12803_c0_seq1:87-851(+)
MESIPLNTTTLLGEWSSESFLEKLNTFFHLNSVHVSFAYVVLVVVTAYLVKKYKEYDMDKPTLRLLQNMVCCVGNLAVGIEMAVCMAGNNSIWSTVDHRDIFKRVFLWLVPLKMFEMLFTFIIIFQMQWRRLTFLEVYYRITMLIIAEVSLYFAANPAMGFFFCVTCFTHVFTHTYFLFSEAIRFPLWVRKALTIFQIVVFTALFVHGVWGYLEFEYTIFYALYCFSLVALYLRFFKKELTNIPPHLQYKGKRD